eukprot:515084_1
MADNNCFDQLIMRENRPNFNELKKLLHQNTEINDLIDPSLSCHVTIHALLFDESKAILKEAFELKEQVNNLLQSHYNAYLYTELENEMNVLTTHHNTMDSIEKGCKQKAFNLRFYPS